MVYATGSRILRFLVNLLLRNISKNCDCEAFPWNKFNVFRGERVFEEEPEIFDGFLRLAEFLVFVFRFGWVALMQKRTSRTFWKSSQSCSSAWLSCAHLLDHQSKATSSSDSSLPVNSGAQAMNTRSKAELLQSLLQPFKLDSYQSDTW